MIHDDELLREVNVSELLRLIEEQEGVTLRGSTPKDRLTRIAVGAEKPRPNEVCPLTSRRRVLETFIQSNLHVLRSQLGVCRGLCTSYGCPPAIAMNCYDENRGYLD